MAVFKYKAVSKDGAHVSGVVEAYDRHEAVAKIKETCLVVDSVSEVSTFRIEGKELFAPRRIPDKELSLLSSQFAIILNTGLPLVRAVELIATQIAHKQLKELLEKVAADVATGYGLAQSLENKGAKLLPLTFIETVRAGEESGTLPQSFEKLSSYYEKNSKIRSKVKSAMTYPLFLLALSVVVIAIVMVVTVPVFENIFSSGSSEMPALTRGLIAVSGFVASYWWLLLIVVVLAVLGLKLYSQSEKGRFVFAKIALKAPIIGNMNRMKGASQFANTMSTLLTAGIPLVNAVGITAKVIDNALLSLEVGKVVPSLEEGRQLGEELKKRRLLPDMLCEMTSMGENTGSLEKTLDTVGVFYDAETVTASEKALGRLQPAITVMLGVIIGIIVIALYLPMFSMYSGM